MGTQWPPSDPSMTLNDPPLVTPRRLGIITRMQTLAQQGAQFSGHSSADCSAVYPAQTELHGQQLPCMVNISFLSPFFLNP